MKSQKILDEIKEINSLKSKLGSENLVYVHHGHSDDFVDALRGAVDAMQKSKHNNDLNTIKRIAPQIIAMNYDQFNDWLDLGDMHYIERVLPIFKELGMIHQYKAAKAYISNKKNTKNEKQ